MSSIDDQRGLLYERGKLMDSIRTYLLSILSAALLCAILTSLTGKKGSVSKFMQLLCGLFMTICALGPVMELRLDRYNLYIAELNAQADAIAAEGSQMVSDAMEELIIQDTKAYILDKAASMGAELEVTVELNSSVPASVVLKGAVSPAVKTRLTSWIANNLGIPAEAQKWI